MRHMAYFRRLAGSTSTQAEPWYSIAYRDANSCTAFRRRAYPQVGRLLTAGEAFFLARHHKLPTRLLDWSANALVGLYFACIQEPKLDGFLWGAVRRDESEDLDAFDLAEQKSEETLFSLLEQSKPAIKLVHPVLQLPAHSREDGAFTVHDDPWRTLESYAGEDFERSNLDIEQVLRWRIPAAAKVCVIEELSGLGFTIESPIQTLMALHRASGRQKCCIAGHEAV